MERDNTDKGNGVSSQYDKLFKPAETDGEAIERLIEIVRILRGDNGCPWDKAQTHKSLKQCLIEEAYEVCDSIDKNDSKSMEDELGDVLLQVVFHSLLAKESSEFEFKDVSNMSCEKMIRRHPHIFSKEDGKTIDKALERWENVKRQERGDSSISDEMNDIPKILPALTKSYKIQSKARNVGFDWENVSGALEKIDEEKNELIEAFEKDDKDMITDEIGDLLFSVVNISRFSGVNPEEALNSTSQKFIKRFSYVETEAAKMQIPLKEMSFDEMNSLWEDAKAKERLSE